MDAIIRHIFSWIEPEDITDLDKYSKLYVQAKWIFDNITVSSAAKGLQQVM